MMNAGAVRYGKALLSYGVPGVVLPVSQIGC